MKLKNVLAMALLAVLATGCSDDDDEMVSTGVQEVKITSTDESKWTYVNLQTGETSEATAEGPVKYFHFKTGQLVETKEHMDKVEGTIPAKWDLAMNGFNIRTNEGAVLATTATDFASITELPTGAFVQDKAVKAEDRVIRVDMSRMMQDGVFGFVDGYVNDALSQNIKKTPTGAMPPYDYSVKDKEHVFVVKYTNGNWTKIKFTDCSYGGGKKSVKISYEYMSK